MSSIGYFGAILLAAVLFVSVLCLLWALTSMVRSLEDSIRRGRK